MHGMRSGCTFNDSSCTYQYKPLLEVRAVHRGKLSMCNLWLRLSSLVVSSAAVAWVTVKCSATRFMSFTKYTLMSRVYPEESQCL